MDRETLTYLLGGGHLNVPERKAKGLWPHPPLKFEDLVTHIVEALESRGHFPRPWDGRRGTSVIERRTPSSYVRRAVVESGVGREAYSEHAYPDAREAAKDYLRWTLDLPRSGDLDGWTVV